MIDLRSSPHSTARNIGVICFALWGIVGLVISFLAIAGAPALTAVYVALMWIGGMLLFGFCVLMAERSYRLGPALPVYVVQAPRTDGLNETYNGIPYAIAESGHVVAEFPDGKRTFRNWKAFIAAA